MAILSQLVHLRKRGLTLSVRQFVTLYILRPMARKFGIRGGKVMRFTEQGYAVFYFGIMGLAGIVCHPFTCRRSVH